METELFVINDIEKDHDKLERAAGLIKNGSLVAFPTETVYGLGANALDGQAVRRIFDVKGRPMDNPLILHIPDMLWLKRYCLDIPPEAYKLAERFWPGPLTMILKRKSTVPDEVTAGLHTVAVRCPNHKVALRLIRLVGAPVAAPSANISGRPSPTKAGHVLYDLSGKIAGVVDGGSCMVGVESTIVDLSAKPYKILRPGGVTPEQLSEVLGPVGLDSGVLQAPKDSETVKAPGMKYRHYAPKAQVILLMGDIEKAAGFVNRLDRETTGVLCFDEEIPHFKVKYILSYGKRDDYAAQAQKLFHCLRALDEKRVKTIYARCPESSGVGLAVSNRLLKASGYQIVEV